MSSNSNGVFIPVSGIFNVSKNYQDLYLGQISLNLKILKQWKYFDYTMKVFWLYM